MEKELEKINQLIIKKSQELAYINGCSHTVDQIAKNIPLKLTQVHEALIEYAKQVAEHETKLKKEFAVLTASVKVMSEKDPKAAVALLKICQQKRLVDRS
jgi:hypothetical protein